MSDTTTSIETTTTTRRRPRISPELARRAKESLIFSGAFKRTPLHYRVRVLEVLDATIRANAERDRLMREIASLPCNRPAAPRRRR